MLTAALAVAVAKAWASCCFQRPLAVVAACSPDTATLVSAAWVDSTWALRPPAARSGGGERRGSTRQGCEVCMCVCECMCVCVCVKETEPVQARTHGVRLRPHDATPNTGYTIWVR
jgi:hypothetical protein